MPALPKTLWQKKKKNNIYRSYEFLLAVLYIEIVIYIHIYIIIYLSIYTSMNTYVVSISWILWIML